MSLPRIFFRRVESFKPSKLLALVMIALWFIPSRFTYFWRNMNISSFFCFSKSISMNTQHRGLWDTLKIMLFRNDLIKWNPCIGRISWKIWYWFILFRFRIRHKKIDAIILVECPFKWQHTSTTRNSKLHYFIKLFEISKLTFDFIKHIVVCYH